jgi:hypothetical protein
MRTCLPKPRRRQVEPRWGLPPAWAAAIFLPAVSTAARPLRYCRKAPEGSAPRQRRPTLPVRRLSKPRGRCRSRGGFCGGPCGRQTPSGPSVKTKIRIAQLRLKYQPHKADTALQSGSAGALQSPPDPPAWAPAVPPVRIHQLDSHHHGNGSHHAIEIGDGSGG